MDYRSTLNLPATSSPMRANAAVREPEVLARWAERGLYKRNYRTDLGVVSENPDACGRCAAVLPQLGTDVAP